MSLGYAIYPDGRCKVIPADNPKMRGFKLMGTRPHTIFLFTDDPVVMSDARLKVHPFHGKVYKAEAVE